MKHYLNSINQTQFIEVRNDYDTNKKYNIYFGGDYNLFYIEGKSTTLYNKQDAPYVIDIEASSKCYLEIQNSSSYKRGTLEIYISDIDGNTRQNHTIYSQPYKSKYKKSIGSYRTLEKKYSDYKKSESSTYSLLSTNPRITGNLKINIDSKGELYLSVFETVEGLSDQKFQKFYVKDNSNYAFDLYEFIGKNSISNNDLYRNTTKPINIDTRIAYRYQNFDSPYSYGAAVFPSKNYDEKYHFLAPLYIKDKIPNYFVILKKQGFTNTDKFEFFKDIEILKVFDLTENSKIGKYLRATQNLIGWEKAPVSVELSGTTFINFSGIDLNKGSIATKYIDFTEQATNEKTVFEFEKSVVEKYAQNSIVSHNLFNLDFLFDMEGEDFDFSSIFGFYVDGLDLQNVNIDLEALQNLDSNVVNKFYTGEPYKSNVIPKELYLTEPISTNKINDGKRLFYVKDQKSNFYNVISKGKKYDRFNYITLETELDYSNWVCSGKTITKKEEDITFGSESFTYIDVTKNFVQGDSLYFTYQYGGVTKKTYVFEADSESMFDGGMLRTDSENLMGTTTKVPISNNVTFVKSATLLTNLYVGKEILLNDTPCIVQRLDHDYTTNESSVYVESNISLTDKTNLSFSTYDGRKNYFKVGNTIEETLYALEQTINSDTSLPILAYKKGERIFFVSKKKGVKGNSIGLLVSYLDGTYQNYPFCGGTENLVVTITKEEKELLGSSHSIVTSKGTYNLIPWTNGEYTLPSISKIDGSDTYHVVQFDTKSEFSFNNKLTELKTMCPVTFGVFSIYELRTFDSNYVESEWNSKAIIEEYKKYFYNYTDTETLINDDFYTIINDSGIEYKFFLYHTTDFNDVGEVVLSFYVPANSTYQFDTFLANYNKTSGHFYVKSEDRGFVNYRIVQSAWYKDSSVEAFKEYKLLENISNEPLGKLREELEFVKKYSSKTLSILDTEYDRLRERDLHQIETSMGDIPFWQSTHGRDSLWNPYRLNFNRSFGQNNLSVFPKEYIRPENLDYNWFFLDKVPFDINVFESTTKLYGFGRLDRQKLLDTSFDYFEEYFTTGYPQVLNNGLYEPFNTRELYSTVYKVADNQYETFFKGMKYRMNSFDDLTGYKFSILATFDNIPHSSENSFNIVTDKHCYSDELVPAGCNITGQLFYPLKFAIDNLSLGDQTVNITYSFVNPTSSIEYNGSSTANSFDDLGVGFSLFQTEVENGLNEWKKLLESTYSVENGCVSNLTVTFENLGLETGSVPVDNNYLDFLEAEEYGIGQIRLAYTPLGNEEVAHSVLLDNGGSTLAYILYSSNLVFTGESTINDGYSIKLVTTHEVGHILGLGHTSGAGSIMFKTVGIRQSFDYLFTEGLSVSVDGTCISSAYGFPRVVEDPLPEPDLIEDGDYLVADKDDFKFYVNKKFKTICLYITNYFTSYSGKDRSYGYTDLYVNDRPKNWIDENLDGYDVPTRTGIDLSYKGVTLQNEEFSAVAYEKDFLIGDEVGELSENSYFRLRSEDKYNVQISYGHTSVPKEDTVTFRKSYSESGELDKIIFTEVRDGNTVEEYTVPFGRPLDFKDIKFYRIRGGKDLNNFCYRLTMKYFIRKTETNGVLFDIANTDGTVSTSQTGFMSIAPLYPSVVEQNTEKIISSIEKENGYTTVKLADSNNFINLLRYSGDYEPSTRKVITFGLRDELGLEYGVDFYKNNTRLLVENEGFGIVKSTPNQKVSTTKILDDVVLNNKVLYPIENQTPVFYKDLSMFVGITDQNYYNVFSSTTQNKSVSGLNDLKLKRGILNNTLPNLPNNIELTVGSATVVTKDKQVSVIDLDLKNVFSVGVAPKISTELNQIYDSQSSINLEVTKDVMVSNLISNDIYGYYKVTEISIFQKNFGGGTTDVITTDITSDFVQISGVNRTDKNSSDIIDLSWDKKTNSNVLFGIKIKFQFI